MAPLATMGISCSVRWDLVRTPSKGRIRLVSDFTDNIVIIRVFPGPFTTLKNTLQPPLRGAVLQTFGAGNAPDHDPTFLRTLREASERGVVVVNVTQCQSGSVAPHYATGQALADAGVVQGGDMTAEAALVKLGWLLASGRSAEQVRALMATDLRGEITAHRTERFSLHDGGFLRSVFSAIYDRHAPSDSEAPATPPRRRSRSAPAPAGGGVAAEDSDEEADGIGGLASLRSALMPTLLCSAAGAGDVEALTAMLADGAVRHRPDLTSPAHAVELTGRWSRN